MAAKGSGTGITENTFGKYIKDLEPEYFNVAKNVLSSTSTTDLSEASTNLEVKATPRAKDLSAFMAYTASLAFFAYTKPHEIIPDRQLGVKENLTNGATIQHVHKDALLKKVEKIVKFRVTKCVIEESTNSTTEEIDPYLIFTHGTSMVKCNILEDILKPKESSFHYLFIKRKNHSKVKGFIGSKDASELFEGQNEPLKAFEIDLRSDAPPFQTELAIAELSSTAKYPPLEREFGGKKITVEFCCEPILATDFVDPSNNYGNFLWMDLCSVDLFGNPRSNWDVSLKILGRDTNSVFPIAHVVQDASATQAWFYWNRSKHVLVLAFPGVDTFEEMADDTAISNDTEIDTLGDIDHKPANLNLAVDKTNDNWNVHQGYRKAYLSIRNTLLDIVYSITKWSDKWSIIVTGHSDGGSLAALAAYDIATKKKKETDGTKRPKLVMFTFAAPGLGDENMANEFSNVVPFGFRVVASNDQVASVMCSPLYRVGKAIPCDGRMYTSIQDILDAHIEDAECTTSPQTNGIPGTPVSGENRESWSTEIGRVPQKLRCLHGLQNYFTVIQEFLSVLYP